LGVEIHYFAIYLLNHYLPVIERFMLPLLTEAYPQNPHRLSFGCQ